MFHLPFLIKLWINLQILLGNHGFIETFPECNREEDSLDDVCFKKCNLNKFKELASTLKIFLTMSHEQASVERGFSVSGTVLEQNLNDINP